MKLNRRQKKFCDYYSDRTDIETYHNGYKSALKAGYFERNARSTATKLLYNKDVIQHLDELGKVWNKENEITLQEKIAICWQHYLNAQTDHAKRAWLREHGELSGHYKQLIKSDVKVTYNEDEAEELEIIRRELNLN